MTEAEVATKAPESDAMDTQPVSATEPSLVSNTDSVAQTGPTMGEHCTSDRPLPLNTQQPTGEITKLDDTDTYISKPGTYPNTPAKLLLLLTSGTGVHSVNNQLQADLFATAGYLVVMPDQFAGDPAPGPSTQALPRSPETETGAVAGFLETVKMGFAETAKAFVLDMWLARHTPEKVLPVLQRVISAVKDEYADAVEFGGGIYAVGYCFGGKYAAILAGEQADEAGQGKAATDEEQGVPSKAPLVKAGAVAHATLVTREDLKGVKSPLTFVCVEDDPLFPADILEDGRRNFAQNNIKHEIKTYEGVPHGFAVFGDYADPEIQKKQAEAFQQMLDWLNSH